MLSEEGRRKCIPSARLVLCFMVFWGQIQNYMMRSTLSLLIVAMVKDNSKRNGSNSIETCLENKVYTNTTVVRDYDDDDSLEWNDYAVGQVLGAFSIGYVCTQIVGGRMAEYFGFKKLYGLGLLLTCILTFLSPVVARLNVWAFMVLRICQGLFEGVTFPSLHCMTARWIPIKERNSFIARSYFGSVFGLIISYPLCGLLIDSFGWDSAFYVIGGITLTWFLFWTFLVFDTPDSHPRISKEELEYITTELSNTVSKKTKPIPWKSILTSVPFWGMVITDCGNCVGIITLGSYGSLYLKKMLGVDIKANGVLSGVPMLSRYLGGLVTAAMADYLLKHRGWSVVWVRRVFNSICMCGPAVTMAILAFPPAGSQCSVTMTVCLLTTGMFLNGAISPGHFSSPGDLSPNYAGTIFGMSNTLSGGGVGYLTPVMVSTITGYYGYTFEAWTIVFSIASSVYIVANIFYFFMISGSIQPWNDYDSINK